MQFANKRRSRTNESRHALNVRPLDGDTIQPLLQRFIDVRRNDKEGQYACQKLNQPIENRRRARCPETLDKDGVVQGRVRVLTDLEKLREVSRTQEVVCQILVIL